jgi:serine/threonine-protein kinase
MACPDVASGVVIGERYRLERRLGDGGGPDGSLWLATDTLAADAPVALRQVSPDRDQSRLRAVWSRLQGVLHPQVPRHGAALEEGDHLWLVRDWQQGRTYRELLEARRERQLVFGAGEVLLMLRQFLPVLTVLHGQDLVHGDLCPANLLRRDSDGLPVPLDLGLMRGEPAPKATPGYAPVEQVRGEPAEPWMDLHALGVVALVLLSGDEPEALLDPVSLAWRWPAALEGEEPLRQQLERLVTPEPNHRFASAGQALAAFQRLEMPESTGPVARADPTARWRWCRRRGLSPLPRLRRWWKRKRSRPLPGPSLSPGRCRTLSRRSFPPSRRCAAATSRRRRPPRAGSGRWWSRWCSPPWWGPPWAGGGSAGASPSSRRPGPRSLPPPACRRRR